MSNLARTDAEWLTFGDRIGFPLRVYRWAKEARDRFEKRRTQIVKLDDVNNNFDSSVGDFALSGMELQTHTDDEGVFYVRVTGGGDPRTVSVYSASGASGLIAQGTANAGAVATLTAQNSSGVSGTFPIRSSVTADSDNRHKYQLIQDWVVDAEDIYDGTEAVTNDDGKSLASVKASLSTIRGRLDSIMSDCLEMARRIMISDTAAERFNPKAQGKAWVNTSVANSILNERQSTDGSGNTEVIRDGILEDIRQAMADEATGSTQYIIQRVTAGAAATADTNNDGQLTIASHTPDQNCKTGTYVFECTSGLGNGGGGSEKFRVKWVSDEEDEERTFAKLAQVGQTYEAAGFGAVTLARNPTKTDSGSDMGAASAASVTGETENNTDSGILHWETVANGANWDINFYKSSGLASGDKVASATNIADGASYTASATNSSGLSVSWELAASPSAGTGTLNLEYNVIANSTTKQPDTYRVVVTETSTGRAARLIAELFGGLLNGTTSGSETLTDGRLARMNTFPEYVVTDN